MRGTIHFESERDAAQLIDGVPAAEQILEMEIDRNCSRCGADTVDGGYLENTRIDDGVLRGETVCDECIQIDVTGAYT